MSQELEQIIDTAWESRAEINYETQGEVRVAVNQAMALLDSGAVRVAERLGTAWIVHQWLKKAVLLSFALNDMRKIEGGPDGGAWWDKVPSKFAEWGETNFQFSEVRFSRSTISGGTPFSLRCTERCTDAELHKCRSLCRQWNHD